MVICQNCSAEFKTERSLKAHTTKGCTGDKFQCENCGKIYSSRSGYHYHKKQCTTVVKQVIPKKSVRQHNNECFDKITDEVLMGILYKFKDLDDENKIREVIYYTFRCIYNEPKNKNVQLVNKRSNEIKIFESSRWKKYILDDICFQLILIPVKFIHDNDSLKTMTVSESIFYRNINRIMQGNYEIFGHNPKRELTRRLLECLTETKGDKDYISDALESEKKILKVGQGEFLRNFNEEGAIRMRGKDIEFSVTQNDFMKAMAPYITKFLKYKEYTKSIIPLFIYIFDIIHKEFPAFRNVMRDNNVIKRYKDGKWDPITHDEMKFHIDKKVGIFIASSINMQYLSDEVYSKYLPVHKKAMSDFVDNKGNYIDEFINYVLT